MVADDLIDLARLFLQRVFVAQRRDELVAGRLHSPKPEVGRDARAAVIEIAQVDGERRGAGLDAEVALWCRDLEPAAALGEENGAAHAGVRALIVEEQHSLAWLCTAGKDVPGAGDVLAPFDRADVGEAAGSEHDDVWIELFHHLDVGEVACPHVDLEPLALRLEPLRNGEEGSAPVELGRERELPADPRLGLDQGDVVAAFCAHARRLEARGAAAYHDDAFPRCRTLYDVRHRRLTAGRRVLQAERLPVRIDAVDAVVGADAVADLAFPPLDELAHDMRVGDVGACHGYEVDEAVLDGARGRGEVDDAAGVQHRDRHRGLDGGGQREVGRGRKRHARD